MPIRVAIGEHDERYVTDVVAVDAITGRPSGGGVGQVSPDLALPADLLAAYDNFDGVVPGDFVTIMKTSNGQSILALSGSPETIGESTIVLDKPAAQPCALEFEGSIVRTRHQFATAGLFENLNGVADPTLTPINIVSISQSNADNGAAYSAVAGTIVTIVLETALPQWPQPGAVYLSDWVHVTGLVDNRLNYPNLAVKFISADRKTITAGFSDEVALPSLAVPVITPTLGDAKLNFYNNMSGAHDGVTMRFTGTTDTSAALLTLFGGGDAQVSGTLVGDHRVTIGSTARNLVTSVNGELELKATTRFRVECRPREVSFHDRAVDNSALSWTTRLARTGVKPGTAAQLRPRMRLYRPPAMSRPVAKIVSAAKSGTTTATVTTASAHGLVTGNYVTCKGARDVTNFANLTTPVAITVTGPNTFTLVWGGAVTATTWGGVVVLANGGQDITVAVAQNAQAAVIDSATGWLTLTGNTTWTGTQAGDYVDLYGVRAETTGADLGLDGSWQVVGIATTALTLKPFSNVAGARVTPNVTTLSSTNCGGAVILRTTIRAHDLMFEAWSENQVMIDGQGSTRLDKAVPVNVLNTPATTISSGTVTTVTTLSNGQAAHDAAVAGSPHRIAGRALTSNYAAVATGDTADLVTTLAGSLIVKPYSIPEQEWNANLSLTTTTAQAAAAAAGAGLKRHITALQVTNTGTANDLIILDGVTERWRMVLPQNIPVSFAFPSGLLTTANTALNFNLSVAGTVRVTAQGYTAP
jgi:hypothetical protein